MKDHLDSQKFTYTFGTFSVTFTGLGLPFLSDKAKELIANMPLEDAKVVNKEAWKQRNQATKIANRHSNISINGNMSLYDRNTAHAMVAELVCKETYKRMCKG